MRGPSGEESGRPISFQPLAFKPAAQNAKAAFGSMMNLRTVKDTAVAKPRASLGPGDDYGVHDRPAEARTSHQHPYASLLEQASLSATADSKLAPPVPMGGRVHSSSRRLFFN